MATTNYPTALDDTNSLPNPGSGDFTTAPSHANQHDVENDALRAIEAKVGIGASTPTANKVLRATGTGTTAYAQVGLTTDVTGTLPVANGGTGVTSLGSGVATFLGTPSSANLASAVTDETGTGLLVFNSSPTIVTPTIASFTNAQHNHSNAAGGGTIDQAGLPLGTVVQIVSTNYSAVATGTTVIPTDDTIPQITEGNEYMTQSITPKSTTNRIVIEITALLSNSAAAADLTIALFQDSTANALAASQQTMPTSTYMQNLTLRHDMVAGTTSSTIFRVRGGGNAAGTTTFNGQAGTRRFGGITISNIKITEYKA